MICWLCKALVLHHTVIIVKTDYLNMKKFYKLIFTVVFFCCIFSQRCLAQELDCSNFAASYKAYESRCAGTGSIKVFAVGGSGLYKYKVTGTINTNFTSTDSITGLGPGLYSLIITDITTNCTITINNITVDGSYKDPRFTMNAFNV